MDLTNTSIAVAEGLELFKTGMREQLASKGVNASGKLNDSLEEIIVDADGFVSGSVRALSYWYFQQYGRGATKATGGTGAVKAAIRQWIDDKGISPRPSSSGRAVSKDELAFLIARKIHREGFEGKLELQEVIDEVQPRIDELIAEAVYIDLNEQLNVEQTMF